ncbi:tRNA (guanine(9)-N1)-methyltransferase [Neolecta irregularis DAH-3]|uniref:tRNA (guanine(9)-N1)-methyltransferase n=1 Tax=Neolecta irregularis (strain DAH-3) TaxID=1198029 RepID=A0A1U7LWG9_NEOID|nr:tRNA (guanine(9)-N1)-methyltransferase [Neolecta irregularis DAH-3]|eukprot:OLL26968.1 tRNA (guanine(9)-N1)-methyltransferase [Neolecta irregularis DAH-3]
MARRHCMEMTFLLSSTDRLNLRLTCLNRAIETGSWIYRATVRMTSLGRSVITVILRGEAPVIFKTPLSYLRALITPGRTLPIKFQRSEMRESLDALESMPDASLLNPADEEKGAETRRLPACERRRLKKELQKKIWEEAKPARRKAEKEKRRAKKVEKRKEIEEREAPPAKRLKPRIFSNMGVIIDCGFDNQMTEKEIISLQSQITRLYSINKSAPVRVHLQITSFTGQLKIRFLNALRGQHTNWTHVIITEEPYMVPEQKLDFVYLTADSENVISELEESKTYIIGGLVDKNRHKSMCFDKAVMQGIATARLPIEQHIKMSSRKVLTVNQVFEILSGWMQCRDWDKAFMDVIPKRKAPELASMDKDHKKHSTA